MKTFLVAAAVLLATPVLAADFPTGKFECTFDRSGIKIMSTTLEVTATKLGKIEMPLVTLQASSAGAEPDSIVQLRALPDVHVNKDGTREIVVSVPSAYQGMFPLVLKTNAAGELLPLPATRSGEQWSCTKR